jgi:hypothetical protein
VSAPRLPAATAARLVKVCGLLGSDFDGERAEAARRATQILRDAGLTWRDLVAASPASRPAPREPREGRDSATPFDHVATVRKCLDEAPLFSAWECAFLRSIQHWPRLSPRQWDILERLVFRTGGVG